MEKKRMLISGFLQRINGSPKRQGKDEEAASEHRDEPQGRPGDGISVYRRNYHIVGVSFSNADGSSRQKTLKKILKESEKEDPAWFPEITIKVYDYEGSPAVGVYADGVQVGNIKKEAVESILENHDTIRAIDINVFGGMDGENYGAEISIIYQQ